MVVTDKARAYLALAAVRDRWDSLSDSQRAEVADLVARLSVAMRRESVGVTPKFMPRPLPLVGRISA